MIKSLIFGTAVLVLASSCATNSRKPSSDDSLTLAEIIEEIDDAGIEFRKKPSTCLANYNGLYKKLFELAGDTAFLDLNDIRAIDRDIQASFSARIALKETIKNYSEIFSKDLPCYKSATDVFRGLRYVEDYLIELRMEKSANGPAEYVNMQGEFPFLLVNPKYAKDFKSYEDLRSGDVILSRGNAFSSAAIARIGENDSQFSHLSFVYRDPETNEAFTTEAHIEIGSVVAPLMDHVSSKNSRSAIFRYKDPEVSHQASKAIRDRVKESQEGSQGEKKNITYDFAMNYKDDSKLFCSEVISSGFKKVLPDEDYFPMFKSKFSSGIIPFLNTIGVPATKENIGTLDVFAPGDIQFDPRFELVAEWRNPRKMEESRLKDFILTKLFERMEKENYEFDPTFKMDAQARALWLLRRTPVVKKALDEKFSLTMNPAQMELFMGLDKVGEDIYKEVEKASLEFDRPMTPKEIYAVIDAFFRQDFELYKRYKKGQDVMKPTFHLMFHP